MNVAAGLKYRTSVYSRFSLPLDFRNLSALEVASKQDEKNKIGRFGSLKSRIKESWEQHVWKEVTTAVSGVGADKQTPVDEVFKLNIFVI